MELHTKQLQIGVNSSVAAHYTIYNTKGCREKIRCIKSL